MGCDTKCEQALCHGPYELGHRRAEDGVTVEDSMRPIVIPSVSATLTSEMTPARRAELHS